MPRPKKTPNLSVCGPCEKVGTLSAPDAPSVENDGTLDFVTVYSPPLSPITNDFPCPIRLTVTVNPSGLSYVLPDTALGGLQTVVPSDPCPGVKRIDCIRLRNVEGQPGYNPEGLTIQLGGSSHTYCVELQPGETHQPEVAYQVIKQPASPVGTVITPAGNWCDPYVGVSTIIDTLGGIAA